MQMKVQPPQKLSWARAVATSAQYISNAGAQTVFIHLGDTEATTGSACDIFFKLFFIPNQLINVRLHPRRAGRARDENWSARALPLLDRLAPVSAAAGLGLDDARQAAPARAAAHSLRRPTCLQCRDELALF